MRLRLCSRPNTPYHVYSHPPGTSTGWHALSLFRRLMTSGPLVLAHTHCYEFLNNRPGSLSPSRPTLPSPLLRPRARSAPGVTTLPSTIDRTIIIHHTVYPELHISISLSNNDSSHPLWLQASCCTSWPWCPSSRLIIRNNSHFHFNINDSDFISHQDGLTQHMMAFPNCSQHSTGFLLCSSCRVVPYTPLACSLIQDTLSFPGSGIDIICSLLDDGHS